MKMEIEKEILLVKLQHSEQKYRSLFVNAPYSIVIFDTTGKILDCNPISEKIFGFRSEELIGQNYLELKNYPPEIGLSLKDRLSKLFSGDAAESIVGQVTKANGKPAWLRSKTSKVQIGNDIFFQSIIQDITKEKEVELKLKESEELYKTLLRTSPDAITVGDMKGNIIEASERTAEIHGFDNVKELLGLSAFKLIDKADHERATKKLMETLGGQMTGPEEFTLLKKDQTKFSAELMGNVLRDASGKPKGVIIATRDVTDRKIAEHKLNQSKVITDNLKEALMLFEMDGSLSFVNPAFEKLTSYESKEILGKVGLELGSLFFESKELKNIMEVYDKALQGEEIPAISIYFKTKSGKKIPIEFSVSYVKNDTDKVTQILNVITDITERKEAEDKIRQSEKKFRDLVENINEVIYTVDTKGILTYISPTVESFIGYHPIEVIGHPFTEFIYNEDLPSLSKSFQSILSGQSASSEYRVNTKSGEIRWMRTSSQPIFSEDRVVGVQGVLIDITEEVEAEEQLKESELKFRHLFERSPLTNVLISMDGVVVDCNSSIERVFGFKKEEIVNKDFLKLNVIPSQYFNSTIEHFRNIVQKGLTVPFELQVRKKDGSLIWVFAEGSLVELADKSMVQVVLQDINDRKLAEEKLRESEEKYRLISENANDLIIVHNQNREVEYLNEITAQRLLGYGYDYLKTQSIQELFHPDDIPQLQKAMPEAFEKGFSAGEYRMRKSDGSYIWTGTVTRVFQDEHKQLKILTVARDISERKALEESRKNYLHDLEMEVENKTHELKKDRDELQKTLESLSSTQERLIQSEKLASIGLLAAGVAHEINNPLTGIISFAQIIYNEIEERQFVDLKEMPFSFLQDIVKEGKRISTIVEDLLTFARPDPGKRINVNISGIIRSSISLLLPKIHNSKVVVKQELDENLPEVPINSQKIQQVLINVLQNSIAALDEKFGHDEEKLKNILIQTSLFVNNEENRFCKITIIDNGQGIREENLPKLFDPFFTTKSFSQKHGVGLGLSISYGIIKDHNGEIQIKSTWRKGTEVDILLPLEKNKIHIHN